MPDTFDVTRSVEICPEISWVGVTDEKTPFKCNPYVLDDGLELPKILGDKEGK